MKSVDWARGAKQDIFAIPMDGSPGRNVCDACGRGPTWSSDGKRVLFVGVSRRIDGTGLRIGVVDLNSDHPTLLLAHPAYQLWQPHFSPDDRWVAFLAVGTSTSRIYVVPFFHSHSAARSLAAVPIGGVGLSVARDKLVFNMAERTGNIWMTEIGR